MDPETASLLFLIVRVVAVVCWIIVVVSMFVDGSALQGIFGIFCGLYAFYWGWTKWEAGIRNLVMIVWTVCIIGALYFGLSYKMY